MLKYWEMDDKREVPQRQTEAYYKMLDNPCVHHTGCLISLSAVNERCKDVGKTGFLNCQLIEPPYFAGISSVTHGVTSRFHSPASDGLRV